MNRRNFIVLIGSCGTGLSAVHLARLERLTKILEHQTLLVDIEQYRDPSEELIKRMQREMQQRLELNRKMVEEIRIDAIVTTQRSNDIIFDKSVLFKKYRFPCSPILSQLKAPFFHKSRARSHL